eukprot:jgi/Bigna1/142362/aug1.69_g17070
MGGPLSSKQPLENTFETFRKESGAAIGDLTSYVSSWLNDNPLGEIHIGADSKSVEGVIIFASKASINALDETPWTSSNTLPKAICAFYASSHLSPGIEGK